MMDIKWDMDGFEDFASKLTSFVSFESEMEAAVMELAEILRKAIQNFTPTDTYRLRNGWVGKYTMTKTSNGILVSFINDVPYGWAVNYGHYAKNQFGGPYQIKHRTVALDGRWGQTKSDMRVYGHFFLEKGVLATEENSQVENIIKNHLVKWWKECFSG